MSKKKEMEKDASLHNQEITPSAFHVIVRDIFTCSIDNNNIDSIYRKFVLRRRRSNESKSDGFIFKTGRRRISFRN